MRAGCAAALALAAAGCALISTGAYVNHPAPAPEANGPGTTIATMAVPWHLDFQCNGGTEPCPTPEQAAACLQLVGVGDAAVHEPVVLGLGQGGHQFGVGVDQQQVLHRGAPGGRGDGRP